MLYGLYIIAFSKMGLTSPLPLSCTEANRSGTSATIHHTAEEGIVAGGVRDVNAAAQEVPKTALIHRVITCGSACSAANGFDTCLAGLDVLAPRCNEPVGVKMAEAPCAEHQVNLLRLMTTGHWGDG